MSVATAFNSAPTINVNATSADSDDALESLLVGLLEELVNSALLVATTTSIANWMLKHSNEATRRNLTCYLPPSPALFQQSLLKLSVNPSTLDITSALREFYDRLEFLRSLANNFSDNSCDDDGIVINVLSSAWQDLALVCRSALSTLGEQLADHAAVAGNSRYERVMSLLPEVEIGHHPCVSSDGVISVPFWADRRTLRRRQSNLEAYVAIGDQIEKVAVLNASDHGIGVLGLKSASPGDRIRSARPAWHEHQRQGDLGQGL